MGKLSPQSGIATTCLLAFVGTVAVVDLRTRRIPNQLTLAGMFTGLAVNLITFGPASVVMSAGGLMAGCAVFLPLYLLGGMGAGDVKAMAAVGVFVGAKGALLAAGWILVTGAIAALLLWAARRAFTRPVASSSCDAADGRSLAARPASLRFPYGASIACGTVAALLWS